MARILVADSIAQQGVDLLSAKHDVVVKTGLTEDELIEALADCQALVVRSATQVTARVIEHANGLEVIARAGTGVDNVDIEAATQRGVIVVNAPLANTISTAEHAFALMMAMARHIPQADAALRAGEWARNKYMGVELAGKTLGIVGLGRIGSEVARRARAFEMRVIAYDPYVTRERYSALGVEQVEFDDLLAQADFVTLHTALYEGTRGQLGAEQFANAKRGIRIINAARGALIEEQALYDAVASGQVGGAAIDVFSSEPAVGNILTTHERIVVTPHLAASTSDAQDRAAVQVAEQIIDVLDGRSARYAVNAPMVDEETMGVLGPYIEAAKRAGSVAMQLAGGGVQKVRIEYLGEIGTYDTAPLRAGVIVGLLERVRTEKVTIVNAEQLAQEHGLRIEEDTAPPREPYANLVVARVATNDGEETVAVTHTTSGLRIVGIGEYEVEVLSATPYVLAIENIDRPGMIGRVGGILGEWGVNVSAMSVAAGSLDLALMVLCIARPLTPDEVRQLEALDDIYSVRQIVLD
ncbi:MAG: phosphoglycerate dehydrogenase [Dehalococcoidia bacterium]|nr:phosphoglycerate dehydrogenase [Dehalococcoidia bacterium]